MNNSIKKFLNEINEKHSFSIPVTKKYRVFSKLESIDNLIDTFLVLRLYMENIENQETVLINSMDFFPITSICSTFEVADIKRRLDWKYEREKQEIFNMSRYFSAIKELEQKEPCIK
jgi:hypothetical protein